MKEETLLTTSLQTEKFKDRKTHSIGNCPVEGS